MKRRYIVKRPFMASIKNVGTSRIFQPGETLWLVDDYISNPVNFESDFPLEWRADRNEFITSVEPFSPGNDAPTPK